MMTNKYPLYWILVIAISLLTGCLGNSSKPASYYVLNPDFSLPKLLDHEPENKTVVAISAVHLPPYLDRKQIVSRNTANGLLFSEEHRWGGKLRQNLQRVIAKNLSYYLSAAEVVVMPHSLPVKPRYYLEVHVEQFERQVNGKVQLSASWRVIKADKMQLLASGMEDVFSQEKVPADDYQQIVAQMSTTLGQFSRTLAEPIAQDAY